MMYVDAKEVMQTLGVSRNKAYKIIKELNEELEAWGFVIIAGKCSRKYFNERFYGYEEQNQKSRGVM